jgi:MFS family permease
VLSLLGVALIYAYFLGLFAYLTQLGAQAKLTEEQSGYAVALAVGVSILGSGAAAVVAKRLSYLTAFLVCLPANAVALLIFGRMPDLLVFFAASGLFGFFWGFLMPFQMPFVIESDPSRRASLLAPGIQSVGAAAGPLICSFFVTNSETRGALYVCAAFLLGTLVIAASLHTHRLLKTRSVVAGARA